ncbi:ABC transporter permease subunit [Exiguobacterium marinum]|uniref:ABC transporter permease subunit n=1 Tax=Exiguobacterium marinum TaxID=273528 RepID=A0ABY7WV65_9BACL|nr:ABC transporter permease subunit [Exiguobacterium marinum]WDH74782.1 ABC transporter permease subunit [Exiguobacterium marinum]
MLRSSVALTIVLSLLSLVSIVFLGMEAVGTDWASLLTDETWRDSLFMTLYVVSVSTILSLIIGTWLARTAVQQKWRITSSVIRIPMFVPHIAAAYLILLLFSGPFGSGWIEANERDYVTVILTYIWKETPFVFLMMLGTYEQLNRGYLETAKTLQLSPVEQFKHAEFPFLIKPLLDATWIMIAFVSFAYEVPALLGVTYPKLLGVLAYERLSTGLYLEASEPYAVALVWTWVVGCGVCVSYWLTSSIRRRIERGVKR